MKFELAPEFEADFRRLTEAHRDLFRRVIKEAFVPACDRRATEAAAAWPARLRVKRVEGTRGIMEMTWSFSGPDGRATFEWITVDAEPRIRWRRVGTHAIFREP